MSTSITTVPKTWTEENAREIGLPSPDAMNLLMKFAEQMQGSVFLPKSIAAHPANILGVILTGREMGLSPMQSLRLFWVSPDGRLAMYADNMMTLMRKAGVKFPAKEFTDKRAYLKAIKLDGEEYEAEFTIEDAHRAGLDGKEVWKKYPKDLLRARVIGATWRFLCPELGGGQIYSREEAEDFDTAADEPVATASAFAVGRKSAAKEPEPATQPETQAPAAPLALPEAPIPITLPKTKEREPVPVAASTAAPPPAAVPEPVAAPAPPTPAPEPAAKPKPVAVEDEELMSIRTRIETIKESMAGSPTTAQGYINAFAREWAGITDPKATPKDRDTWKAVLPILEALLRDNPKGLATKKMAELVADCRNKYRQRDSLDKLAERYQWSEVTMTLCREVQRAYKLTTDEMIEWLFSKAEAGGLDLTKRLDSDVQAFFEVSLVTREAARLWTLSDAISISVKNIVDVLRNEFKTSIADAGEKRVLNALTKMEEVSKGALKARSSKPEPVPEEPAEGDNVDPFDLI